MILTIAIPTYNRNLILQSNLALLLPQLTLECQLLIIDNYSATPVENALLVLLHDYPSHNVRIIRNRANIGANANILRCFEYCETEWLWCLSDDDTVKPDSIKKIFTAIVTYPESIGINFMISRLIRNHVIIVDSQESLVDNLDDYSNLLFVSNTVFNATKLRKNMNIGYQYSYSCAPHLALLIVGLGNGAKFILLDRNLIDHSIPTSAPLVKLVLGTAVIAELFPVDKRSKFIQTIIDTFPVISYGGFPLIARAQTQSMSARIDARMLYSRYSIYDIRLSSRLRLYIIKLICTYPHIFGALFRTTYLMFKRKATMPKVNDDNKTNTF